LPIAGTHTKLAHAFLTALDLPPDTDLSALAYGRHPHWDSIGHMALVAEIEDAYDLMLDTDDVLGLSDFAAAADLLERFGITP
jgi:acyl carrier protein